ncbi:N-formylglutamate amidohydrolase [Pelagibius sp. Alg239-R121]|uniref:N-formylglutamate amidohydrolase n=1 Tax=Pelagibius sp. Alg239-R121 TaxID=2993448 RepID=UPI0024A679A6|nr:N-formylglutamate amidohydrolase [Pelagibius sp. Alg239-R121]
MAAGANHRDASQSDGLLGTGDPAPFEVVNPDSSSPVVLTCEHAGRKIPRALGDLGVADTEMDRHIAYDIGAAQVARRLNTALNAVLILQSFSRLVIDCNRPVEAPDSVPEISDGTRIPGNSGLDATARQSRFDAIHRPFHQEISRQIETRTAAGREVLLVAVHSFTPQLRSRDGPRPWHIGLLYNRSDELAEQFMQGLNRHDATLHAAFNEPYRIDDRSDYTIPVHGEGRGIPHVLLEIRNDLIAEAVGQNYFARLFAAIIGDAIKERTV